MLIPRKEYNRHHPSFALDQQAIELLSDMLISSFEANTEIQFSKEQGEVLEKMVSGFFNAIIYKTFKDDCISVSTLWGATPKEFEVIVTAPVEMRSTTDDFFVYFCGHAISSFKDFVKSNQPVENFVLSFDTYGPIFYSTIKRIQQENYDLEWAIRESLQSLQNNPVEDSKNELTNEFWPSESEMNRVMDALHTKIDSDKFRCGLHLPLNSPCRGGYFLNVVALLKANIQLLAQSTQSEITLLIPGYVSQQQYVALQLTLTKSGSVHIILENFFEESPASHHVRDAIMLSVKKAYGNNDKQDIKFVSDFLIDQKYNKDQTPYLAVQKLAQRAGITEGLGSEDVGEVQRQFKEYMVKKDLHMGDDEKSMPAASPASALAHLSIVGSRPLPPKSFVEKQNTEPTISPKR